MRDSITYLDLWHERLDSGGDEPFLITAEAVFSYNDVWRQISRLARRLKNSGINEGEFILVRAADNLQTAQLILALPLIAAAAAPLNRYFTAAEVETILSDNSFAHFITDDNQLGPQSGVNLINTADIFGAPDDNEDFSPSVKNAAGSFSVIFSSGSSQRPNAVVHSFSNHYFSALGSNENIEFTAGDVWLLSLPLYHIAGLSLLFRSLLSGAALRIISPSESIVSLLKTERITHISLVETQFSELLQNKSINDSVRGLKAILIGGSAVSSKLIEDAYNREWKIHTTYGSSEMCSQVTTTPPAADLEALKFSGNLLKYRELQLNEDGEILLRGETLSSGYLRAGKIVNICDEEGWYASGDLGMIDKRGVLNIKGRIDNMFISGGENVYPEVIERAVKLLPGVKNAMVVPVRDDKFGQRPALFLQMETGSTPDAEDLKKMLRDKLAAYMLPAYVFPWPQKTEKSGIKISRKYFKELAHKQIR